MIKTLGSKSGNKIFYWSISLVFLKKFWKMRYFHISIKNSTFTSREVLRWKFEFWVFQHQNINIFRWHFICQIIKFLKSEINHNFLIFFELYLQHSQHSSFMYLHDNFTSNITFENWDSILYQSDIFGK